jgi:hypothetical protein
VSVLQGSVSQATERIAALREEFEISYFTLNLLPGTTKSDSKRCWRPPDNYPYVRNSPATSNPLPPVAVSSRTKDPNP